MDSRISHHRKCLPGLGPQARLGDDDSVHLPVLFLFLTSGPGESFVACATLATVDRALIWPWWWEATLIASSTPAQMAAACTSIICTESQSLKPFLSPAPAWCLHLSFCDQWLPFTKEYVLLTPVPMGHPAQSIPQDNRKPWGIICGCWRTIFLADILQKPAEISGMELSLCQAQSQPHLPGDSKGSSPPQGHGAASALWLSWAAASVYFPLTWRSAPDKGICSLIALTLTKVFI